MPPSSVRPPRWWSHLDPRTRHGQIYLLLLALRSYSAFLGHGYIHPDEWMQSGEPYFGFTLPGIDAQIPWEWRPDQALRSLSTLRTQYLAVDALLNIVRRLGPLSGRSLFLIQRAQMLLWTVLLDINVALVLPPQTARYVHYLFGVSTAATTFLVRPFSNSHEAHLLAFCLLHVLSFYRDRTWYRRSSVAGWHWGVLLAILAVDGIFTRFTFAFFAAPLAVFFLHRLAGIAAEGYRRPALVLLGLTVVAAIVDVGLRVDSETGFYTRSAKANGMEVADVWGTGWVVPPLNALRYNVKTDNVAQHGLHPRWLHVVVNLPMMVGVANCVVVVMCGWQFVRSRWSVSTGSSSSQSGVTAITTRKRKEGEGTQQTTDDTPSDTAASSSQPASSSTSSLPVSAEDQAPYIDLEPPTLLLCLCTITLPLLILSLSPHQEPRFLLALAFPSTIIMAFTLQSPLLTPHPRLTHTLLTLHITQHLLQHLLLCYLHQAALLPTLFHIDTSLSRLPFTNNPLFHRYQHHLLYRTFPPPFHMLPNKGRGMFPRVEHFTSSSTPGYVVRTASVACDDTWIYAPGWVVEQLKVEAGRQGRVELVKVRGFGGHVDMDYLQESWEVVGRVGVWEAFAVQKLEVRCLTGGGQISSSQGQQQQPGQPPSHQDL